MDYDFAVVLVIDKALDGKSSPTIHASYAPTLGIRPGRPGHVQGEDVLRRAHRARRGTSATAARP